MTSLCYEVHQAQTFLLEGDVHGCLQYKSHSWLRNPSYEGNLLTSMELGKPLFGKRGMHA